MAGLVVARRSAQLKVFDLETTSVRELNRFLHSELPESGVEHVEVLSPNGLHSIAVGVNHAVSIDVRGHGGYYLGGMNQRAEVTVHGNVGWGVAENMMSGSVRVKGFASEAAGASGHGGLLVIEGDASLRCGISMKGIDIVVGGRVGNYSAFMAQAGNLVVCGDAGDALGDSLYEATLYVRGRVSSLGADAHVEEMSDADYAKVAELLQKAGFHHDASQFRKVASMRSLYHWNADANQEY
jgi:glutamate synthase domain-containing protein 3